MTKSGGHYECVVLGGGPGGTTAATLLADYERQTLLLERARFPRHHIGESLMPETYDLFERLGVLECLRQSGSPTKEAVQFVSSTGGESQPFYFTDRDPHDRSTTWQVRRDEFDLMLMDNARRHGVEVREGVTAHSVMFEGDKAVGVRVSSAGDELEIGADVVIDATGQSSLIAKQLDLRRSDPDLRNASIYAYYRGAKRGLGRDAGSTIIVHTPDRKGWFWFIPLRNDVTSIGLVAPPAYLFSGRGDKPIDTLESEIERCPWMKDRLVGAERVGQEHVARDFSYRARRVAGDGWVLVGDAYCFLDPIYSSGVLLAMKSGEMAAAAINDGFRSGDLSGRQLGRFAPAFLSGVQCVRQLVYAFYDPAFSFARFISQHPQHRDRIVRILIGDVFDNDLGVVFDDMRGQVRLPGPIESEGSM